MQPCRYSNWAGWRLALAADPHIGHVQVGQPLCVGQAHAIGPDAALQAVGDDVAVEQCIVLRFWLEGEDLYVSGRGSPDRVHADIGADVGQHIVRLKARDPFQRAGLLLVDTFDPPARHDAWGREYHFGSGMLDFAARAELFVLLEGQCHRRARGLGRWRQALPKTGRPAAAGMKRKPDTLSKAPDVVGAVGWWRQAGQDGSFGSAMTQKPPWPRCRWPISKCWHNRGSHHDDGFWMIWALRPSGRVFSAGPV
jgi:hypothetical protein